MLRCCITQLDIYVLLLSSLQIVPSNSLTTFSDKTNSSLHCVLRNDASWDRELTVEPPKHVLTDVNTTTGNKTKLLIYGSSVTLSCKDPFKTFRNKIVALLAGSNLQYNIFRKIKVTCSNAGVLSPDVFNVTSWCETGCSEVQFGSGYQVRGSPSNTTYPSTDPDSAPVPPGKYSVACNAGHVTGYGDKGVDYTECKDGRYTTPRDQLITCAPGCRDISTDIVPYIRGLYIDTSAGDNRNMIWPGAPYPTGVTVTFSCYGDDQLVGERVLTCNQGNSSRELGWFSHTAPTCQLKNSAFDNYTKCGLLYSYLFNLLVVFLAF